MKIGVVSLYYKSKNLGGLLQSYAMICVLLNLGYDAEQIRYDTHPQTRSGKVIEFKMKFALLTKVGFKKLYRKTIALMKMPLEKIKQREIKQQVKVQDALFEEFEQAIPHSERVYSSATIKEASSAYEGFVCGSDQVWNPMYLSHPAYFLDFVPLELPAVPYAVSTGKSFFTPFEQKLITPLLKRYEMIGVRENSLKGLLEKLSKAESEVVLDPTLLLSPQEWIEMANFSNIPTQKYLLCYLLGNTSWQRTIVKRFADEHHLLIVSLPYIMGTFRKSDEILDGEKRYDVGPREFVALISQAQFVFTDSFHAMAFSLNFGKEFYVFDRNSESGGLSMNSRIVNFLQEYGMQQRHITNENLTVPLSLTPVKDKRKLLTCKIRESYRFLFSALAP